MSARARIALALFVVVAAFDLWWIARALPREQFGDEWRYLMYADDLLHGFYSPPGRVFVANGPGYPLFLVPFAAAHWLDGARLANALLHAGAIVYAWWILSSRLSLRGAAAALTPLAIYPPIYAHLPLVYTETLALFLAVAWIHHALSPGRAHTIAAGLLLGALCLTKVLFAAVLPLFLVAVLALRRRGWRAQAALAFALCLPYLAYTHRLTGKLFYFASGGGQSFYWLTTPFEGESGDWYHQGWVARNPTLAAHHKATFDRADGLAADPTLSEREQVFRLTTPEADAIFYQAARDHLRAHPAKFARNWMANVARLFVDVPTSVRGTPFWNAYSAGNLPMLIWTMTVVALALRRRLPPPREFRPVAGFGLLALAAYSVTSAMGRFFIPIAPMLWLPACVWSASLWPPRAVVPGRASSSASAPASPSDA